MDSNSDEQTELLRNIWNQMKDLDRSLRTEIKVLGDRLDKELVTTRHELGARIDNVTTELSGRIDGVAKELATTRSDLSGRIDGVAREVAGLKYEMREVKTEITELRNEAHQTNLDLQAVRLATQVSMEFLAKADRRAEQDLAAVRERVARIELHVGMPAV